jgi:Domain of unknown function (DUF4180)
MNSCANSYQGKAVPDHFYDLHGVRILERPAEGSPIRSSQDAIDLIGEAHSRQAAVVVIPAERLGDDFFRLKTGLAGEIIQKFVTYGVRLAILGDLSHYLNDSDALRDFVYESNNASHCWFVTDRKELQRRLVH